MRDFEFVRKLPALRVLNLLKTNHKRYTGTIDLSPLSPLKNEEGGGGKEGGGGHLYAV
jgi:hypothetical protein